MGSGRIEPVLYIASVKGIADVIILSSWTETDSLSRAVSQSETPLCPTPGPMCSRRLESPLMVFTSPEKQVVLLGNRLLTVESLQFLSRNSEKQFRPFLARYRCDFMIGLSCS